jgi:hypothetical protein
LATPAGLEPATNSLEGAWSRNDFNARSDIFTVRAPFEAIAEFRFVGMPAAGWCASRLRCRSNLHRFEPHLIYRRRLSGRYGIQYAGRSIYFQVRRLWQNCGKSLELAQLGLDVLGLNRPVTAPVVLDKIGQTIQLGGFWSVGAFSCHDGYELVSASRCAITVGLCADPQRIDVEILNIHHTVSASIVSYGMRTNKPNEDNF